jgi:Zn finger protein HypA/HybF involved in hydrogenase expression
VKIKPAVAVPLIVVLLGAAAWRVASHMRHKPMAKPLPHRCEACGYEFTPDPDDANPVCPKCGASATLTLLYFRCQDCGETFVAYEADPAKGLMRSPGGEWINKTQCDYMPVCPACGSGRTYAVRSPDEPAETPRRER